MCYYQPAERVQTHSSEALFPGYVTIMNDGPSGGVNTKHGVVTLLLDRKKVRSLIEQMLNLTWVVKVGEGGGGEGGGVEGKRGVSAFLGSLPGSLLTITKDIDLTRAGFNYS